MHTDSFCQETCERSRVNWHPKLRIFQKIMSLYCPFNVHYCAVKDCCCPPFVGKTIKKIKFCPNNFPSHKIKKIVKTDQFNYPADFYIRASIIYISLPVVIINNNKRMLQNIMKEYFLVFAYLALGYFNVIAFTCCPPFVQFLLHLFKININDFSKNTFFLHISFLTGLLVQVVDTSMKMLLRWYYSLFVQLLYFLNGFAFPPSENVKQIY